MDAHYRVAVFGSARIKEGDQKYQDVYAIARGLAEAGLDVSAYDVSAVAIEQLRQAASSKDLSVDAQVRDIIEYPPARNSVDVLVVSYFLDRHLCSFFIDAIKPGGLLFYQTYCHKEYL